MIYYLTNGVQFSVAYLFLFSFQAHRLHMLLAVAASDELFIIPHDAVIIPRVVYHIVIAGADDKEHTVLV